MNIQHQLIEDCIKEDRMAQFRLYELCYPILLPVCLRYENNKSDAVSVLNQGFFKILKGLKSYSSEIPFEAWTKRVVINTIIDEFRKNRKVKELVYSPDIINLDQPNTEMIAYNLAEYKYSAEELEIMVRQLPNMTQKVFNLYAIDGYTHKEIADLLAISPNTSKWHLANARQRLILLLRQELQITNCT